MRIIILLLFAVLISACASNPRTWGNGAYRDVAADDTEPQHYSDKLNEHDQRRLLDSAVAQLGKCPKLDRRGVFTQSVFEIQGSELMDIAQWNTELNHRLAESLGLQVILKDSRPEIVSEMDYQSTGYTAAHLKTEKGQQKGTNFLIRAILSSQSQHNDETKQSLYSLNLQVVDLTSSLIVCSPKVTIGVRYSRTRVSF